MSRLKLLTMATLMALTITACDEGEPPITDIPPPPTPVGTISGTVTIDGTGATGITATLSSGATMATGAGGTFSFGGVEAGSYTVTISGYPADAAFPSATQAATIASDGQTVQLNFAGEYIRSSSLVGNVVAADPMMMGSDSNGDGRPDMLDGITVTLEGEHTMAEPQSTMEGGFAFTGLRAGSYTVMISGYPEDVKFETPSMTVEVGVGDVGMANFEGAYIRTAAVEGRVIIEGEGLAGVTVTLTGGPGNDNYTKLTGADGGYAFTELRPGDYQISISGYDPDDYEFASSSHDVSVDLDETETVSFTGVLLRTSGISGRVSVEGMGIADIAVTLSGAAADTTMTDASGQYAFAGLAAGDYTVSIAVASNAYVFDSMSSPVTVGDDDSQIVNFEGDHDTSASLSVMLFIDEASKNDMHDPGEDAFPSAAMLQALQAAGVQLPPMLPVPVSLVGPAVNRMQSGALNLATGQITFSDLQAGSYQLQVGSLAALAAVPGLPAAAAALLQDFEYGGPAEGYAITIGVAEPATHNVPVDITHTTVDFTVALKHGDDPGPALEGATVTLYRDAAGNTEIDSGETGADGTVAIRFARAGGTMVHAAVSADGYDVAAEGLQAVTWNSQSPRHAASNEADIVNLNVAVTVSGATVTTEHGGGNALAGWAISVMKGAAAVEGAPGMLGADGTVPFTATVGAGELPVTYTFAVAADQDDELDGGETYKGSGGMYMHDGLSLAGTQGAATVEVQYTSQTLKVYVYQERDQVMGYTGNVLGGDVRMSELVDLDVRRIGDNGLSRPFSSADWDAAENTEDDEEGGYTFANLPADEDVVVLADARDGYKLLDPYRLDTYRNIDENGVMGGAFGEEGGFGHTVSLCPLTNIAPAGQDHGECGSFAVVSTHDVSGLVWKRNVKKDGTGFKEEDPKFVEGITVSLAPVQDKNIAGDGRSFTTLAKDDKETDDIDERNAFRRLRPRSSGRMEGEAGRQGERDHAGARSQPPRCRHQARHHAVDRHPLRLR